MNKTIVFTFGRFSPLTIGHVRLFNKVTEVAKIKNADHNIFISQTYDNINNPLDWSFKIRVCKSVFKNINISENKNIKTPFMALDSFIGEYRNVILVVGQDQLIEFQNRMTAYAKTKGFIFSVISAGDRIIDSNGIEGISATKMRQYAKNGNKNLFFDNLPMTLSDNIKHLVYRRTRQGLK